MSTTTTTTTSIFCIYHANCIDGLGAANIIYRIYPEAEFYAATYGEALPWHLVNHNTEVYIVDFSYPKKVLEKLASKVHSLRVFDHHKTTQVDLDGLDYCTLNMEESGCTLVASYLAPQLLENTPLYEYIKDYDLWQHKFPESKAIHEALTVRTNMTNFTDLHTYSIKELIEEGITILKYKDFLMNQLEKDAIIIHINNIRGYIVNAPYELRDILGNSLAIKAGSFAIIFSFTKGSIKYSIRSVKELDISEWAKYMGGGGHANAAGFSTLIDISVQDTLKKLQELQKIDALYELYISVFKYFNTSNLPEVSKEQFKTILENYTESTLQELYNQYELVTMEDNLENFLGEDTEFIAHYKLEPLNDFINSVLYND